MTTSISDVVLESSGEVRDRETGHRIGSHDPARDATSLRSLCAYVGAWSRLGTPRATQADLRMLALTGTELAPRDAQTPGTLATDIAPTLDAVADIVCPVTFISKSYGTYLYEDVTADVADPVLPSSAGTGEPPALNPKLKSLTVDATMARALACLVPEETSLNSDIDLQRTSLRRLMNAHKMLRELSVSTLLTTAGSFPSANQTAAAVKWNGTSPTPLVDVFAALGKSLVGPAHLVITEPAAQWFYGATPVFQYLAAGGPLPEICVAKMRKMVAGAVSYVWGGATSANAVLVCSNPGAVTTARTFRWLGNAPDAIAAKEADGYALRSFIDERSGARGQRNLVLVANDVDTILDGHLGGIITGVLA